MNCVEHMIETTIERLGHHGDGIAPGPLYVPRTLPGEVVSGTPDGRELRDLRIVEPSSDRVKAPCRHYKSCGGCQVQHASDAFVENWKIGIVSEALRAQDIKTEMRPIVTSPIRSRRRATFSARRTKKGATVGFHGRASDVITEIPDCLLIEPDLRRALPVVEAFACAGASRKGKLSATATLSEAGLDLSFRGGKPLDGQTIVHLAQLAEQHDLARVTWDGEVIATRHAPIQRFGAAQVVPPPGSFLQATQHAEDALLAAVKEVVKEANRVCDLFAGCGTFSLPLAANAEVHAVEGESDMIDALDQGWRRAQGLKRVSCETRDLFRRPLTPDELSRFEVVILDPPRAGASAQVRELAAAKPKRIAYVSCNPVTFAQDAATLIAAGYCLDWVQVVDQFRWSAHVELAASLSLSHMAR